MSLLGNLFSRQPTPDPAPAALRADSGAGRTELALTSDRGKKLVIVRFPSPRQWIGLDPIGARNLGDALHAEADFLEGGGRLSNVERMRLAAKDMRERLIIRVTIMLNSMQRDGRKPTYQASHVVDEVLRAIEDLTSTRGRL